MTIYRVTMKITEIKEKINEKYWMTMLQDNMTAHSKKLLLKLKKKINITTNI